MGLLEVREIVEKGGGLGGLGGGQGELVVARPTMEAGGGLDGRGGEGDEGERQWVYE